MGKNSNDKYQRKKETTNSNSDSEIESGTDFPRFIMITSLEETPLANLSLFLIEINSLKKKKGNLLVSINNKEKKLHTGNKLIFT